ncbi:A-kinase anchoring protein 1 [Ictidomys tridecemlineatus]|nr:A-kinase anchoring protein 1 [Ictidomys tridecemlineatus]
MAIHFRSLFPLALPGMLALLGWWWFFSRKKEQVSSNDKKVDAGSVVLRASPDIKKSLPIQEACPGIVSTPRNVTQPLEKEQSTASKPSVEPLASLRTHPTCRRSESSGCLPNPTDTRSQPGTHKDDTAKVELALMGDKTRSVPLECPLPSPKDVVFPHEAIEVCKQEVVFSKAPGRGWPSQSVCAAEKQSPGEKARETRGAEGTGDAMLGENVLEEGLLSQERVSELENSKALSLAPLGGGGEKGSGGPFSPLREESAVGKLLSSSGKLAHAELAKDEEMQASEVQDDSTWDRDMAAELGKKESLDKNERIEQAAFQIISQVILEATEEVLASTGDKMADQLYQASGSPTVGQAESSAPASQKTVLGQDTAQAAPAVVGAASGPVDPALPLPGPPAENLPSPKTYVSCLSSPLSSPTKDSKPKNSAHHISLAPCPPPASPLRESVDEASILAEDATCATCVSASQSVPSAASSGQCSDSVSTSGLEDSCTETNSSPRDKAITPPLPDSTVPFSNGVLKGELSDLGTEDGWTADAEADHSGGSDGNSMDSVDSCCGLKKTDSFQNAQAGSNPKKVDLIIWEIEVPKHLVGRLIGKQGRYVSFLKQTSGAKIYISTLPYTQNIQICHIEGSQHHVDKALNLIGKKFKELNLTNIYAPPLPSLALPSLPMTSWVSLLLGQWTLGALSPKSSSNERLPGLWAKKAAGTLLPMPSQLWLPLVSSASLYSLGMGHNASKKPGPLSPMWEDCTPLALPSGCVLCFSGICQVCPHTLLPALAVTVICAAPGADGAWWRAQVVASYEETNEVEIRYVDYGGYKRVKVDVLRQIRSDFVTLPFQGAEVLLDSVMPLSGNGGASGQGAGSG